MSGIVSSSLVIGISRRLPSFPERLSGWHVRHNLPHPPTYLSLPTISGTRETRHESGNQPTINALYAHFIPPPPPSSPIPPCESARFVPTPLPPREGAGQKLADARLRTHDFGDARVQISKVSANRGARTCSADVEARGACFTAAGVSERGIGRGSPVSTHTQLDVISACVRRPCVGSFNPRCSNRQQRKLQR